MAAKPKPRRTESQASHPLEVEELCRIVARILRRNQKNDAQAAKAEGKSTQNTERPVSPKGD